jgi:hypothetical protein
MKQFLGIPGNFPQFSQKILIAKKDQKDDETDSKEYSPPRKFIASKKLQTQKNNECDSDSD